MKKLIIIGVMIAVVFGVLIYLTAYSEDKKYEGVENVYDKDIEELNPATKESLTDTNYAYTIPFETFKDRLKTDEQVYAYFYSPTCGYCQQMTPVLTPIMEQYDKNYVQLNVLEYPNAWEHYRLEGTPTLIYFEKGKEVAMLNGYKPEEVILEFIEAMDRQSLIEVQKETDSTSK